ncbi:hypothetical protein [Thiobacillus sp.]|uniref:hypothetical protein n=1 Tax=Thiobacillus sp. TaxID=924 RepID=UPI0025F99207|nr:hypothetical protein [Thiobacillus sp.]MBT9539930.1 hypothetical protein [Thiobacillus sp.]
MATIKIILQWLGGIFLLLCVVFVGMAISAFFQPEKTTKASPKDVEFVLNWGGIEKNQKYSVVYSYESPPTFNGDHAIYHCIQLANFVVDATHQAEWRAGPEADPLFSSVIESAAESGKYRQCFSKEAKPNTSNVLAYMSSVHLLGRSQIEGAEVLLYEPATKRLLYSSHET